VSRRAAQFLLSRPSLMTRRQVPPQMHRQRESPVTAPAHKSLPGHCLLRWLPQLKEGSAVDTSAARAGDTGPSATTPRVSDRPLRLHDGASRRNDRVLSAEDHRSRRSPGQPRLANPPAHAAPRCGFKIANEGHDTHAIQHLFNPLYKGEVVWGRTKKRDAWGRKKEKRPPGERMGRYQRGPSSHRKRRALGERTRGAGESAEDLWLDRMARANQRGQLLRAALVC
jgi:hypothetical protein